MAGKHATEAEADDHEHSIRGTPQPSWCKTRQTLEVLRTRIGFILPIVVVREGPRSHRPALDEPADSAKK
jgi:hypothetical protein